MRMKGPAVLFVRDLASASSAEAPPVRMRGPAVRFVRDLAGTSSAEVPPMRMRGPAVRFVRDLAGTSSVEVPPVRMRGPAVLFVCALAATGCGIPREDLLGQPHCPDFEAEIAPVLADGCAGCHGGLMPAAGYSVVDRLS